MQLARSLRRLLWPGALVVLRCAACCADGAGIETRPRLLGGGAPSDCRLQPGGESTVLSVAGPQTLRLADGRFVRLAEILAPAPALPGLDPSAAATAYLRQAAVGKKVEVKFGGTQRDRYGVYIGHVYVAGEPALWLQEGLVASGLALVFPQVDNHACAKRLLAAEGDARDGKRGHWGLAYFKVLKARDARSILNLMQTYQIVEGTAMRASESGGRITLHFGEDKYGFTAIIEPPARKWIADKQTPGKWEGLAVRIRGWIEKRRGPSLSASLPEQIEFLPPLSNVRRPPLSAQ